MCVIVFKPANIAMPSEEDLRKMAKTNDDGQGFMYPCRGEVIGEKFHTVEGLIAKLARVPRNTPVVLHFRLATHGGKGIEYAQPFPFPVQEQEELYLSEWEAPLGVAHNGVLNGFGDSMYGGTGQAQFVRDGVVSVWDVQKQKWVSVKDKEKTKEKRKLSDTQDFLRYLSSDRSLCKAFACWDKATIKLLGKLLPSKWAFLNGYGKVKLIGDWQSKKGLFYSNLFWVNRVVTTTVVTPTTTTHTDRNDRWERWNRNRGEWSEGKHWDHIKGKWVEDNEEKQKLAEEKEKSKGLVGTETPASGITERTAEETMLMFSGMY